MRVPNNLMVYDIYNQCRTFNTKIWENKQISIRIKRKSYRIDEKI